jgi:hypothetical protein
MLIIRPLVDILVGSNNFFLAALPRAWGGLYILLLLLYLVLYRFRVFDLKIARLSGIFILASIPSIFFTQDLAYGVLMYSKVLSWSLSFIVFFHMFRFIQFRNRFIKLIPYLSYFYIGIYLLGLILYFGFGIMIQDEDRLYGYGKMQGGFRSFFESVHGLAFQLLFVIFFEKQREDVKNKVGFSGAAISLFSSVLILTTLVRSAILGLLVYWFGNLRKYKLTLVLLGLVVWGLSSVIDTSEIIEDRVYEDVNLYQQDTKEAYYSIGSGRVGMWAACLLYFGDQNWINKMIGAGLDADRIATEKYYYNRAAHNDFIYVLLSMGIVSVILFSLMLHDLYKTVYQRRARNSRLKGSSNTYIFWSIMILMNLQSITISLSMIFFAVLSALLFWRNLADNEAKQFL